GSAVARATPYNAFKLSAYGGDLYFTDLQRAHRMPVGGGSVTAISPPSSNVTGIHADDSGVFYVDFQKLAFLPHGATTAVLVHDGSGNHSPDEPVTDATHVYWLHRSEPGAIWKAGKPQPGNPGTDGGFPADAGTGVDAGLVADAGVVGTAPVITVLDPNETAQYSPNSQHVVNGSNFHSGCAAYVNGSTWVPSRWISASQVEVTINSSLKQTPGVLKVTIDNGSTNGGRSNEGSLTVLATTVPTPTIGSLRPPSTPYDKASTTLRITGSNFVNGAQVKYGPVTLATQFVSSTALTAVITSTSHPPAQGTVTVIVENPGAVASNGMPFEVTAAGNPVPWLDALNTVDASATVGGPDKPIKLGGANFLPGSVARVNGNPIPTQYGHEEQLYATIPASYFAQTGTLTVDVFNAAPG
ncbi:MAG: IPT/TIG domain-containing protein, partial [Myxococcales bacterium]